MNKKALIIIVAVVGIGAAILAYRSTQQQDTFANKVSDAQSHAVVETGNEVSVSITGYTFKPDIIKVKKGTKITWHNKDNAPHTVTSDTGKFLDSPVLSQNSTYEKTFDDSGVYRYHCTPHPGMLAAVIVE